jgi:chitinase
VYAFFGLLPSGHLRSLDEWLDLDSGRGNIRLFNNLKQQNPNLKTLLAVGGWNEGSEVYSDVASDPVRRRIFAVHARELLQEHNFDGLDMDWEYPGQRGGGPQDRDNFSIWLEDIREEFAGTGYLLTAAVGATETSGFYNFEFFFLSIS